MTKPAFIPTRSMLSAIIQSLLDTDLYKFTMWQCMLHQMPNNHAVYSFVCRNTPAYPLAELEADINRELDALCSLRFQPNELAYLGSQRFIKQDFIDFLSIFQLQRRFITVSTVGGELRIEAAGPQVHVMPFEIYVLSIVNELYYRKLGNEAERWAEGNRRLDEKISYLQNYLASAPQRRHPFQIVEFGTRRRYSREWHAHVTTRLKEALPDVLRGTSNVFLAMKLGLTAVGTMAHELLQSTQQLPGVQLRYFQQAALEMWVKEYRGDLGIALTDVVGMDAFMKDCDRYFSLLFNGFRHDSGDPFEWGEKAIKHFESWDIDPHTKVLAFSDGLNLELATKLYERFNDRIKTTACIGTNFTNDMGIPALNIVMKLMLCNGGPVAKLSDSPGKTLCKDENFLTYVRDVFNLPQPQQQ